MMRVQTVSVQMVREVQTVVAALKAAGDGELAQQLHRASRSVVLNIAEGLAFPRGARQANHLRLALGSARESAACMELAVVTGVLGGDEVEALADRVDYVCRMLFLLLRA
ncbi:MAG: hypothetical protein CMN30_29815 [Sandaracinus sp.]|nr:hypothetical protein [Sandaracinus sp.]